MNSDNVTTNIVKKYYPSKNQNLLSEHPEDAVNNCTNTYHDISGGRVFGSINLEVS